MKRVYFVLKFAAVAVIAFGSFSNVAFAKSNKSSKGVVIGKCDHRNGLRYKITYTPRVEKGRRIVMVEASVEGESERQKQKWYAVGWDQVNGEKAFVIARNFGLALVDGDSDKNVLFAPGMPADPIHCINNLKPVLKD